MAADEQVRTREPQHEEILKIYMEWLARCSAFDVDLSQYDHFHAGVITGYRLAEDRVSLATAGKTEERNG